MTIYSSGFGRGEHNDIKATAIQQVGGETEDVP
jgi:hypothetical protein